MQRLRFSSFIRNINCSPQETSNIFKAVAKFIRMKTSYIYNEIFVLPFALVSFKNETMNNENGS